MKYIPSLFLALFMACTIPATAQLDKIINPQTFGLTTSEIVLQISRENMLKGPAVGFTGSKPEQYKRFERLMEKASEEQLLEFTDHENGVVRVYALWGLAVKDSPYVPQVLEKHRNDDTVIATMFGCIIEDATVIAAMRATLEGDSAF